VLAHNGSEPSLVRTMSAWLFQEDREIPVDHVPELPSNLARPRVDTLFNGIAARDVGRCIAGALAVARREYDHDLAGDPRTGKHHPRAKIALSRLEGTKRIEQADGPTLSKTKRRQRRHPRRWEIIMM
jgi:hypothetical protein